MSPGVEFDNTVVELRDDRGRLGEVVRTTGAAAIPSHDYAMGRRVGEFTGFPSGDYALIIELQLEAARRSRCSCEIRYRAIVRRPSSSPALALSEAFSPALGRGSSIPMRSR